MKGYKVTNEKYECKGFKFEIGETYQHKGRIELCSEGFHYCKKVNDCFSYYGFDTKNKILEIESSGKIIEGDDKDVCSKITIIRELSWEEMLVLANLGGGNSGHSNSGYSNSGYSNSGDSNSGYSNSGYSNSGNWNSGDRNSGDSNSGYRNSGAFCLDNNPKILIFDELTDIYVKDWENSEVYSIMRNLNLDIWVSESYMTDEEKEKYPTHKTTGGYLKRISMQDAWSDLWNNLTDSKKQVFKDLPNFNSDKFKEITGIEI